MTTFPRSLALLAVLFLLGCGPTPTTPAVKPSGMSDEPAHSHASGGPLVDWGDSELHLEVVIDRPTATATVYVFGEDAKTPTNITTKTMTLTLNGEPPTVVTLSASPQEGETAGKSSRFVGKHDGFKKEERLSGSVSGQVGENKYTGKFKEKTPKK